MASGRKDAGAISLWLMLGVCSLSVLRSWMSHCSCLFLYGSETVIWKEKERSRIRTVQMDNLRCLLGIRRMDKSKENDS